MTSLFHTRDLLARARVGLSAPETDTCVLCGDGLDASEMASAHCAGTDLTEAEKHYGGSICCHCFEDMATCAHCGSHRRERDMFSYTGPVCSIRCDADLEHDTTARDERLTWSNAR